MSKTRNNHYVPQWYQGGFAEERANELRHLKFKSAELSDGSIRVFESKKWYGPAQCFYERDLYSTFFGAVVNDTIEKQLFGPIDHNGAEAVNAFLSDDQSLWHHNFHDFFIYLDAQKLRTPKGLGWIRSKYPELNQDQLMIEMQELRAMHCTLWAEGVRELVSAEDSEIKFILSDHPITIYNYACPPDSDLCHGFDDPDISLKGTQTIFPLSKDRCLILTNTEYAKDPDGVNPLGQRTNPIKVRQSLVNTSSFINNRKLTSAEVIQINYIIKSRSRNAVAAGTERWLYPEKELNCTWEQLRYVLLPSPHELAAFGGDMFVGYSNGDVHYQDAFGRSAPQNDKLKKYTDESALSDGEMCGCGSNTKYQDCCKHVPHELRSSWNELSIRERNLSFCCAIKDILGINAGKTWLDIRREITDEQISEIYGFYSFLWPRDTDIYSLLPKSDGKFRALYAGVVDVRTIGRHALPMASLFDEYLIESPLVNPNSLKPKFSPVTSPSKYRYQCLKDFLLILELEPYIGYGLINLIPDPSDFDLGLKRAMMEMATGRPKTFNSARELHAMRRLAVEDLLNLVHVSPREVKVQFVVGEFGLSDSEAAQLVDLWQAGAEASPLTPLQSESLVDNGNQYSQFNMVPNYEMALFIAQATGSVIATDSESRWYELQGAQHMQDGVASYPWNEVYGKINRIPMDYQMIETYTKSQCHFTSARTMLREADVMVSNDIRDIDCFQKIDESIEKLNSELREIDDGSLGYVNGDCKILAPDGGICDVNVLRLFARSGCLRYDKKVRSIYYIR